MSTTSNKMIGDFSGKPATVAMYTAIESYVTSLGATTKHLTAQVSLLCLKFPSLPVLQCVVGTLL